MVDQLDLPGHLDTEASGVLRDALKARRGGDLALDASKVSFVGGACFQVLLAARRSWRSDGHALIFDGVSEDFDRGMTRLGLPLAEFAEESSR